MHIEQNGPKIGAADIVAIEADLSLQLPDSYREFLLRYNGGVPSPDTIDILGFVGSPTDVQIFFGIRREILSSDLRWNFALLKERCNVEALPIACDSGGNLFCLLLREGLGTEVIYCDLDASECTPYLVAMTFEDFVSGLHDLN